MDECDLILEGLVHHTMLLEGRLALEHGRHNFDLKVLSTSTYTKFNTTTNKTRRADEVSR